MDSTNMLSCTADLWEGNKEACKEHLSKYENWKKLPCFNCTSLQELKDGQLVRYRGMVQDTFNPEYFLGRYEVMDINTGQSSIRSGRYRDSVINEETERIVMDSVHLVNEERHTVRIISIPAFNTWAKEAACECCNLGRDGPGASRARKRHMGAGEEEMACGDSPDRWGPSELGAVKRCRSTGAPVGGEGSGAEPSLTLANQPLPDLGVKACLAKLYDFGVNPPAVNTVIDVVGFLSLSSLLPDCEEGEEGGEFDPTGALTPGLHVVLLSSVAHCNPMLPPLPPVTLIGEAESTRQNLHLALTQVLLGDELAANYLICHLISRVYLRSDTMALGHLSLNLCLDPGIPEYGLQLYRVLAHLVPASHYIPLSMEVLVERPFAPRKDYKTNRLVSGRLQLAPHTQLLLDETTLAPTQLDATGTKNVWVLDKVLKEQTIEYDFEFYQLQFPTDLPVLILSERKALLRCAVTVALKPQGGTDAGTLDGTLGAVMLYLQGPVVEDIRRFLTVMRLLDYNVSEDMRKVVQDDFVDLRREDRNATSGDDLHLLLVLARWLSLSHGRTDLTRETWTEALAMEQQRKERFLAGNRVRQSVNQ